MILLRSLLFLTCPAQTMNMALTAGGTPMFTRMRRCLDRCGPTLAEDAAGAAALVVLLMVGLHLPLMF
jgi:hypothetical protein